MRPSILHELLFALLITLTCTVTPSGLQGHDHSVGGFCIFSSPYVNRAHFFNKGSIEPGDGGDGGNGIKQEETLFSSYCGKVLEALVILCSASPWHWRGFGGGRKSQVEGWSLRSLLQLVLVTVDPWILECKRRTLSFFTIIGEPLEKNKLSDGGPELTDLFMVR